MEEETEFLLKRAEEEATQAVRAADERAADAHQQMAVRYSARALIRLADQDSDGDGQAQSPARPETAVPKVIEEPESFPR